MRLRPISESSKAQYRLASRQWHRQLSFGTIRPRVPLSRIPHSGAISRQASTEAKDARSTATRMKNVLYGSAIVFALGFTYLYITDTRASIHQWFVVPTLRLLHRDPEGAHHAGIKYIKGLFDFGLYPRERGNKDAELGDLHVEVFGHILDNPIGTSAGIDKNADIPDALFALGPAIVEVGGATPRPQEGNPKPRVFRLPSQNALINRYGLNSEGADHVAMQLRHRVREYAYQHGLGLDPEGERLILNGEEGVPPGSMIPGKLLAVQVAKNKATPDNDLAAVAADYVYCVDTLAKYADILVVNVSSPNTPGLRDLQATAPLTAILSAVVDAAKSCDRKTKPAVMVKVSPDEDSDSQVEGICSAVWASGVDGVIVGNTTKKRPDPVPKGYTMPADEEKLLTEVGGYSGPQMFSRTLDLVKKYRSKLDTASVDDASASTARKQQSSAPPAPKPIEPTPTKKPEPTTPEPPASQADSIEASTARDTQHLKPLTHSTESQSLLQFPDQNKTSPASSPVGNLSPDNQLAQKTEAADSASATPETASAPTSKTPTPAPSSSSSSSVSESVSSKLASEPKVIFATGGITNGSQCLEILNAGASVCQVYTAMMYGGVGTITRMKREMREEMANGKEKK